MAENMVGKAEASATLTVHGKTEYFSVNVWTHISLKDPWTAILNSLPLWVVVQLHSNAI